jgi:hypothetical protein
VRSIRIKYAYRQVSGDYVVAVEPSRFGPLQWLLSWALLSGTADDTIVELLHPQDVVVRERGTGELINRRGPFFGADAELAGRQTAATIAGFRPDAS